MTDKVQKPAIRFAGFTDDWEQRKLRDTLSSLQNNTLTRADLSYERGVVKNVHYGDILIKFGECLDVTKERLPLIMNNNIVIKYKSSFLRNGDVIVADTAEDETVGKCSELMALNDAEVLSGLHTIPYRPLIKFASGYLGYYMNSESYHDQLLPLMQGIKVTSISKTAMQDTSILFPNQISEQTKIGTFFQSLDNLITLHQRKCEKLKNIKKSMLQKMFPKNGEKFPEVRFAGFTDAWEQRKLGELTFSVDTGKSKFTLVSNGIYAVLGSTAVIGYDNNYDYEGDFLLTARVGANAGELYRHTGQVKISDNTVFIQGHNIDFIYYLLMNFNIKKLSFGTGQPLVKASELKQINLLNPINKSEQTKIGTFFQSLDNLITLHQRKVEKLQNIKKACLEKMFV